LDIYDWNFNSLDLTDLELVVGVRKIFENMNFFEDMSIGHSEFVNMVWECRYYYSRNKNPFHNFHHAVTVCHAGAYFLSKIQILSNMLSKHQKLAFTVACLGHDLDHRGRTNLFEINSKSDLAIRYFDKSPLENHHAAILFKILSVRESDIFKSVADDKLKEIKLNIIENILATDMKVHFPMLADFKKKIAVSKELCRV